MGCEVTIKTTEESQDQNTNDLLAQAIAAHGGLERWNKFHKITTTIVGGGGVWPMEGLELDFSSPGEMTVTLHEERASLSPFGQPELCTAFTPDRIAIETTTGAVVQEPCVFQRLCNVDLSHDAILYDNARIRGH